MNIDLTQEKGWQVIGRRVRTFSDRAEMIVTIPKGQRVSVLRHRGGTATLRVGTLKTNQATVTGPLKTIEHLRDALIT